MSGFVGGITYTDRQAVQAARLSKDTSLNAAISEAEQNRDHFIRAINEDSTDEQDLQFVRHYLIEESSFTGRFLAVAYKSGYLDKNISYLFSAPTQAESNYIRDRIMRGLSLSDLVSERCKNRMMNNAHFTIKDVDADLDIYIIRQALNALPGYIDELERYKDMWRNQIPGFRPR